MTSKAVNKLSYPERLAFADKAVRSIWDNMKTKEWYPSFHLAPYAGWLNDPNGLCYHNGLYHAFYQYHPFSENWGPMHWGHLTSKDLVLWQHQPVALAPGDEFDRDGCFSGTGVSHDGKLYLFYTGHIWLGDDADMDNSRQQQCLAVSEDGIHFEKKGIVVSPPPGYIHFRDPKVWFQDGRWWMVAGARERTKDLAELILFSTPTIDKWDAKNYTILKQTDDKNVFMWECPDFFPLDTKFVFLFSPQGKRPEGYHYRNRFQSGYVVGDWAPNEEFKTIGRFEEIDRGHDFYAPQTFAAADGRRILIAWMDMWESPMPTKREGWSGALTIPRELSIDFKNYTVHMKPIREMLELRGEHRSIEPEVVAENTEVPLVEDCTAYELEVTLNLQTSTAEKYGIWLGSGAEFYVDTQSHRLVLNRHYPEFMISGYRSCAIPDCIFLKLRIFIDRSSMEVFVNDGAETFSSRVYPAAGDRALRLFAINGVADVCSGDVWQMKLTVNH